MIAGEEEEIMKSRGNESKLSALALRRSENSINENINIES
jgi:hypothetical protein